ncbi:MAG: DNA-binding response OmpR family regulator [Candidatus Nitrosomirales archaeon]|jgi:DNA-binding response OmpR family regulator
MVKILLADDEPDITTSIKKGLEHYGFEVDAFNDPVEALSKFKPNLYDLLLIDIRMPKMNGFELYREIRKRGDSKSIVCFITAFEVYYDEFKKIFPDLDVKYFIRKPIKVADLASKIKTMLDGEVSQQTP